jgi:thiamine-phosphate pyrophosphorylase
VRLPSLVFVMDDERIGTPLDAVRALPSGSLVIVRSRHTSRRRELAEATAALALQKNLLWIVADDPWLAVRTGADGTHFPEARAAEALHWRAKRPDWLITCAAHSLPACHRANRGRADAVLLGPVFPTRSHAQRIPLGALRLRCIARQAAIPVYALGGIDDAAARRLSGANIAGLAAVGALAA